MLKSLGIVNFAVIPRLRLDFHAGLNLLTGETGAGKSIIVDALNLLLGTRASLEVIRTGESGAVVEGTFELPGMQGTRLRELIGAVGIQLDADDELTIRREIQANGRSRIFVNDRNVTAATLKAMQPFLVEIHGQGDQQILTTPRAQLRLLDTFAGCEQLRVQVAEAYARWKTVRASLRSYVNDETERTRTLDLIRYQLAEFERIDPAPEEEATLAAEKSLLTQVERAVALWSSAFVTLYDSDESILTRLAFVRRGLQNLQAIDARVLPWLEAVDTAVIMLTDVADGLRRYGAGLEFSPERLAQIENRLTELDRLKRKYGRSLKDLAAVRTDLRAQLDRLENWTEREQELQTALAENEGAYTKAASQLTECRRAAVPLLEEYVTEELHQVALERARFVVRMETARAESAWPEESEGEENDTANATYWSPNGADRIEFLLAANVGEDARALNRTASGGELSRLMLALRTVVQGAVVEQGQRGQGRTLVFDEIDTGIGGKVAESVGRRLKTLAAAQQVICVTHQPQIARFADHHYVVEKRVNAARTNTLVTEVVGEARIGELARMIGGAEDVATARETARWLIESVGSVGPDGQQKSGVLRTKTSPKRRSGDTSK